LLLSETNGRDTGERRNGDEGSYGKIEGKKWGMA
jgi:hypothetical protein